MSEPQTANRCCPISVHVRRTMAARVDAKHRGCCSGSDVQKMTRSAMYGGHVSLCHLFISFHHQKIHSTCWGAENDGSKNEGPNAGKRQNMKMQDLKMIDQQEAFEKCWAHLPLRAAARRNFTLPFTRCRYCRTPPLSHAACASMSTTTTTRDRGDRYGPIEWAQK